MMRFLVNVLAIVVAVLIAQQLLPDGIAFATWQGLIIFAVVLALLNAFIRPIVKILTFPITLITFGLFSLIVNALFFWLAATLTREVTVANFLSAFVAALLVSIVNLIIGHLL
jgi:putative membrane protein